jgi:DNA polymerase III delta subunit
MLYFYYGNDFKSVMKKRNALLSAVQKKRPEAETFYYDGAFSSLENISYHMNTKGLFFHKHIFVFRECFFQKKKEEREEKKENEKFVKGEEYNEMLFNIFSLFVKSEHIGIVSEGDLSPLLLKKISSLEEMGAKVEENSLPLLKEEKINIFSIADFIKKRDVKKLWNQYVFFIKKGISPESIIGIIIWQIRTLLSVKKSDTQENLGISAYQYTSLKKEIYRFEEGELEVLLKELIEMYHESHRGKYPLSLALEKWCIEFGKKRKDFCL